MDSGAKTIKTINLSKNAFSLFWIICYASISNPYIESDELKLLLNDNKSRLLDQWGPQNTSGEIMIYFFLDDTSWHKSIEWFRYNTGALIRIENAGINVIYYPKKKRFMNMNAQRKYDARVKSKEIKNAMENSLNGSQIMQLRSTPTKVILDQNRVMSKKLGAPRNKLSALIWQRSTNRFRSFHYLEENSERFFDSISRFAENKK